MIAKYIKPKKTDNEVELTIYYKTKHFKNHLIKNRDHVVYEFKCPEKEWNVSNYIGYTTNSLEERMEQHVRKGSIIIIIINIDAITWI